MAAASSSPPRPRGIVNSVINNKGVIEANSVGTRDGKIVLGGATQTRRACRSRPSRSPAQITATGKDKGTKGGTIQITGEDIQFAAAMLDVSGHSGGGKILVGGDYGGGRPIPGVVNNPSAALEGPRDPDRDDRHGRRRDHLQRLGHGKRQRRQGDPVVGRADHLRRHDLRPRRRRKAATAASSRCRASSSSPSPALSTPARRNGEPGTLLLDPDGLLHRSSGGSRDHRRQSRRTTATSSSRPAPIRCGTATSSSTRRSLGERHMPDAERLSQHRGQRRHHQYQRRRQRDPARRQHRHWHRHGSFAGGATPISTPAATFRSSTIRRATPRRRLFGDRMGGGTDNRLHAGEHRHRSGERQNNLAGNYALGRDIDASSTAGTGGLHTDRQRQRQREFPGNFRRPEPHHQRADHDASRRCGPVRLQQRHDPQRQPRQCERHRESTARYSAGWSDRTRHPARSATSQSPAPSAAV